MNISPTNSTMVGELADEQTTTLFNYLKQLFKYLTYIMFNNVGRKRALLIQVFSLIFQYGKRKVPLRTFYCIIIP